MPMPSRLDGDGVVKLAAIYGANASGKTKLINGLSCLRNIVTKTRSPNDRMPVDPFRLSTEKSNAPVKFKIIFFTGEKTFEYGIVVSSNGMTVQEEWLYILSGGRQTKCFERATKDGEIAVDVGPGFAKKNSKEMQKLELVSEATTPNQAFITKAWENKSDVAGTVVNWFLHKLTIITAEASYDPLEFETANDEDFSTFLGKYLRTAGTGIDGIRAEEIAIDVEQRLKSIDQGKRDEILRELQSGSMLVTVAESGSISKIGKGSSGEIVEFKLKAGHRNDAGESVYFDFNNESHGTQRLTHLLPALYEAQKAQKVYIIDELDRKLHPLLTRKFISDFIESTQKSQSQLIFTTHDTNLLDQDVIRRDEVWFIEKNCFSGESVLYPLTEFNARADLRLDRGYLNGRFGAIPFFGNCVLPTEEGKNQ